MVLDTNVVSELMRSTPDRRVVAWVTAQPVTELCTTAVTIAEIRYGLEQLPKGRRRDGLRVAAREVFGAFAGMVLPFDSAAAGEYADVVVRRGVAGRPIGGFDAQIAAICLSRGARLATRNTHDFSGLDLPLEDPWTTAG